MEADRRFYVLSKEESEFFEDLCDSIVPEGEDPKVEPGANTVGATSYIDSILFSLPDNAREYFRGAVESLNQKCVSEFHRRFHELAIHERNEVLRAFYLDPKTREQMFDLRSLALEGYYSDYHDPTYEGITAWEYVEFGGRRISDLKKDWSFLKVWKDHHSEQAKAGDHTSAE